MVGYSGTPLVKKLGIKAGFKIYAKNPPPDYLALISPLPDDVTVLSRLSIDIDLIQSIEGVINVDVQPHAMMVKVSSKDRVKDVFNYIKTCDDVMTFDVLEPPLSEIFIDKVKNHEKA